MEVPEPKDGMSKEEWAIRCITDDEFFIKAIRSRLAFRTDYLIEHIELWATKKEMRKFNRRKKSVDDNEQSTRLSNFIWDTRSRVYRWGYFETGLRPMKYFEYTINDGDVVIKPQGV
jgi:hypothetical protein